MGAVYVYRLTLRLILLFTLPFLALALVARALGSTQPPHPALAGFNTRCEGKPRPCWYGVVIGETTEQEAYELLAFAGEPGISRLLSGQGFSLVYRFSPVLPYCRAVFFIRDGLVYRGELSLCGTSDIDVGDLVALLAGENVVMSMPPNELVYDGVSMNIEEWPSLHHQVVYITLLAPTSEYPQYPWHGFVPRWRYCQMVSYFPRCRVVRR